MLLLLTCLFAFSFNRLFPAIKARTLQYSRSHATKVVNEAVLFALEDLGLKYGDLVSVNKNPDGTVSHIGTDTVNINRLKSAVSLKILETLDRDAGGTIKIPIGNLSGMYILSGRGFNLSVRLLPTDSLTSAVISEVESLGINQSRHKISVKLSVTLGVLLLGRYSSIDVEDSILVADTILIGPVPDAFTNVERLDDDTCGDLIDFKAN